MRLICLELGMAGWVQLRSAVNEKKRFKTMFCMGVKQKLEMI